MHGFRKTSRFLRLWLALSLLLAPLVPVAQANVTASLPTQQLDVMAADVHAHHQDGGEQGQTVSGCTQHDACSGSCCAGCAHCVGATLLPPAPPAVSHPVLTPHVARLPVLTPISLRERPPRFLSV